MTSLPPLQILYEDNHLLAVVKPAMMATMGAVSGKATFLDTAKRCIKHKYKKPGRVYLGVVSRLDAMVSGVVLFARTSKAARRLTEQFRERQVQKIYWAIVPGPMEPPADDLVDWIRKDDLKRRMVLSRAGQPAAQEAKLSYLTRQQLGRRRLLEIDLQTGRKHQIRVQLAQRGNPILGDRKYGSTISFPSGIALHSRRLTLKHPVQNTWIELVAPLPKAWEGFGIRLD
jgi:23S rRNA pseudouridine1911/1915/1917 synthase